MIILTILQIIIGVTLIILVLIQAKGTGLGTAFGGQSQLYHAKRGVEKLIFYSTIACGLIFIILSLAQLTL